jgi:hypothetical protein
MKLISFDEAMVHYLDGKTIIFETDVGKQAFSMNYGEQTFLNFTIKEIALGKWYL